MKKEAFEAELQAVLKEAEELQEHGRMEEATAKFLGNEADKLVEKYEAETSPERKDKLGQQMIALQRRIEREKVMFEKGIPRMKKLEERIAELQLIYSSGLVEES